MVCVWSTVTCAYCPSCVTAVVVVVVVADAVAFPVVADLAGLFHFLYCSINALKLY
jgi:hypothetical protein